MSFLIPGCGIRFLSTGSYLPDRVVSTEEIAANSPIEVDEVSKLK